MRRHTLLTLGSVAILCACVSTRLEPDVAKEASLIELCQFYASARRIGDQETMKTARAELDERGAMSNRDWSDVEQQLIRTGQNEHVAVCSWGPFKDANVSAGVYGRSVQFVFGDFGPYAYSNDGKITSWQSKL